MNSIDTFGSPRSHRRGLFNVPLAATVGALMTAANAFLNPLILLPLFALKVNASLHTIALISTAGAVSWFAALLCGSALGRIVARQRLVNLLTAIVRAAAVTLLAYDIHQTSRSNDDRLHIFFVCYVIYAASRGLSRESSVMSLTASLASGTARQAAWIALAAGGAASVLAGLIVRRAIGPNGPGFPSSFSLVFTCAAFALAAAAFFISRTRETVREELAASSVHTLSTGIANALASSVLRRFLVFRLALALLAGADPFYIVYAIQELKSPQAMAGVFLAVYSAALLLSAPIWRALMQRGGNRTALQTIAAIRIVAPLVAVVLPQIVKSSMYLDHVHNAQFESYIFAGVFGALGIAARGQSMASSSYIAEIAPERHHDSFVLLANTSILAAGFTPLIAVRLVESGGFQRLFVAAAIAGLIAVFASGFLGETHARVQSTARTLRTRGARSI